MTIQQDEIFKAVAHGLLLGCILPILFYNLAYAFAHVRNAINAAIYLGLVAFEIWNVYGHWAKAAAARLTP